jgi:hypothetical protein
MASTHRGEAKGDSSHASEEFQPVDQKLRKRIDTAHRFQIRKLVPRIAHNMPAMLHALKVSNADSTVRTGVRDISAYPSVCVLFIDSLWIIA